MHTLETAGINTTWVQDLSNTFTYKAGPTVTAYNNADIEGSEAITMEKFDREFEMVENASVGAEAGNNLAAGVGIEQVYDLSALDGIWAGQIAPVNATNELGTVSQPLVRVGEDSRDADSLMLSLSV